MSSPSTPERHASSDEKLMSVTTPTRADAPASQANVSVDIYNDEDVKDIENQHNLVGLNSSYNATPSDVANMHVSAVNSTINDSMTLDNCKFINESDPQIQHTPSPSENNDMMIPSSPNLTPVKSLDQDLSKEQDTMTSSPTDSQNLLDNSDGSTPTLSRRERRTRLLKCYGLVAVVVLLCAIGIPLVAVLLFKEENSQSASLESNQINSDGTSVVVDDDMMPSVVTESEETTTEPVAVPATTDPISSGKEESDFLLMEDTNAPGTPCPVPSAVVTQTEVSSISFNMAKSPLTSSFGLYNKLNPLIYLFSSFKSGLSAFCSLFAYLMLSLSSLLLILITSVCCFKILFRSLVTCLTLKSNAIEKRKAAKLEMPLII